MCHEANCDFEHERSSQPWIRKPRIRQRWIRKQWIRQRWERWASQPWIRKRWERSSKRWIRKSAVAFKINNT